MASIQNDIVNLQNATNQTKAQEMKTKAPSSSVSSHDFLYLLTQQLQYQDPMNPMDNSQMLAQEAQFATLEQMEAISSSFSNFSSNFQANMLLGQCVRVEVDGQGYVGFVEGIDYTSQNGASILIGDRWFPMSSVTNTYLVTQGDPSEGEGSGDVEGGGNVEGGEGEGSGGSGDGGQVEGSGGSEGSGDSTGEANAQGILNNIANKALYLFGGKAVQNVAKQAYETAKDLL